MCDTNLETKICNKCGEEMDVSKFSFYYRRDKQYLIGTCKICLALHKKIYREKNKDEIKEREKKYYQENKNKLNDYRKKWGEKNKDKVSVRRKKYKERKPEIIKDAYNKYYQKNKDKILERERVTKFLIYRGLKRKDVTPDVVEVVETIIKTKRQLRQVNN